MPVVTNAELASAVQQVVSRVDAREDQLTAWQAGTPEGGPFADGTYAITNLLGETSYFKSPARLQYEVGLLTTAGAGAVATAEAARDAAEVALASAVVQATNASSSASTASTKASEAQVFRNEAANSEANALAHRNAASASASAAALSEADAEAAAIAAAASAASADADATAAAASAAAAATFDPVNFYTKTQTDTLLAAKLATADFSWNNLAGKPTTFTPSAHTHAIADVTGLQTALDGKQAAGSYAAAVHIHSIADVTGLQTALDGKQAAGSYAAASHTHVIADVTGLQSALDSKQPAGSYLTGITGSMVTSALGYTPYNSSNPAGYITGITGSNVTTALGYTPANKSGDTFTGAVGFAGNVYNTVGGTRFFANSGGVNYLYSTSTGLYVQNAADTATILSLTNGGSLTASADMRAPIFYDSDNTGYFVNPAGNSTVYNLNVYGNSGMYISDNAATTSYVQIGTDWVYGESGAYSFSFYAGNYYNWVSAGGGNFGVGTTTPSQKLTVSGTGYATSDFRAPIFYDSNDTGYYVDPASGSRLNGNVSIGAGAYDVARLSIKKDTSGVTPADSASIVLSNRSTAINGTLAGGIFMDTYRDVRDPHYSGGIWFTRNQEVSNLSSSSDIVFGAMISWDSGLPTERMRVYGSGGYVGATNSFRAPIFYDSGNTGYYVDPTGASYCYEYGGPVTYGSYGSISVSGSTNGYAGIAFPAKSSTLMIGDGVGTPSGFYFTNNTWGMYCYKNSIYTTIFYDLDDTAYRVDPTGTSVLTTIYARKAAANNTPAIEVRGGNYGHPRIQTYGLDADSNAWMGLGTDMGGGPYEHSVYFPYGTSGQGRLSIGDYNGTTYNPRLWVYTSYTQINNSTRSPLFYDSDNTGYYIDAAGTSNIWRINANEYRNGASVWRSASTSNWISFYFDASGADKFHFASDGNLWMGLWGDWVSNQWRSKIFYDAADTGYYCDPNGTSYLNTVSLGAQTWRGDITWNTGVNVLVPASAECSFDINSSGVWQVWDLTTGAPMIKCPAGSNVEIGQAGARGLYVFGGIYATGNVTAYSDASVKDNIKPITGALSKIARIGGYTYTRTDLPDKDRVYGGVVAQEIEEVLPEAVFEKEGRKAVDYNAATALLIEAIKELRAEVEALKNA